MNKINDFFDTLKERFTNPFFASFIISWALINWEITLALLYWENGFDGLIDYISKKADWYYGFVYPFIAACLYPFFRIAVDAAITWIKKISDNWNINISKERSVKISKYLRDRERLDTSLQNLEKIINAENVTADQLKKQIEIAETLQVNLAESRNRLVELEQQVKDSTALEKKFSNAQDQLANITNSNVLNRTWKVTIGPVNEGKTAVFKINGDSLSMMKNNELIEVGRVYGFHYMTPSKRISFIKVITEQTQDTFLLNDLSIIEAKGKIQLSGIEIPIPYGKEAYPILYSSEGFYS
ncbi:hypothetical protein RT717_11580 [Imperialibacter roseus]|uniref:Uncharacterized protein n=1 Tax=Imperialibacter roseus TaxID=1324217 RepID=A0ABZ0IY06_9BACT|nr:hypothetical protein [Imperialibacter roseus]WOK09279.1 hypothetical protein RT717_11580 [Imperialibacter roseus]